MKKIPIIFAILFFAIISAGAINAQAQTDKVYKMSEVDEKPVITKKPFASPRSSNRVCDGRGSARVRVVLHKSGDVRDVELIESSGCTIFDENAIKAAKKIEFKPAKKDGQTVSVRILLEYSYFTV